MKHKCVILVDKHSDFTVIINEECKNTLSFHTPNGKTLKLDLERWSRLADTKAAKMFNKCLHEDDFLELDDL